MIKNVEIYSIKKSVTIPYGNKLLLSQGKRNSLQLVTLTPKRRIISLIEWVGYQVVFFVFLCKFEIKYTRLSFSMSHLRIGKLVDEVFTFFEY